MVLVAGSGLAWVWRTQVGDPLAHREKGLRDLISFDRLSTTSLVPVAEAVDEEVAEACLGVGDVAKRRIDG